MVPGTLEVRAHELTQALTQRHSVTYLCACEAYDSPVHNVCIGILAEGKPLAAACLPINDQVEGFKSTIGGQKVTQLQ